MIKPTFFKNDFLNLYPTLEGIRLDQGQGSLQIYLTRQCISVNQQVIKVYSELGSNVSLHNIKALVYNLLGPQVHPIYCIG